MSETNDNLTGVWNGRYDYQRQLDPVGFMATIIDGAGLSARIGADQLGHAKPSMTSDVYWSRGGVHAEVGDALDRIAGVGNNSE